MRLATYSPVQMLRRWLFWSHRWLGVFTCLFCAMWFGSGLVMLYVPYPSWRDDERTAALLPLDASQLNVAPGEALITSQITRVPTVFRLEMWGNEPVYRIVDFGKPTAVSARDGRIISGVDAGAAADSLRHTFPNASIHHDRTIPQDQWTVSSLFSPHRPLHVFQLGDGSGTEIYVSSKTGEIVQSTTRSERFWNWLGSVPHWIYFTVLRSNPGAWQKVIQWTAGPAAVGALLGIWIGILRMRVRPRYASGRITPYRGWLRWHHLTGLAGGIFAVVWLASGWLSVSSLPLFSTLSIGPKDLARYYSSGGPQFDMPVSRLRAIIAADSKEVVFSWVRDQQVAIVLDSRADARRVFDATTGEPADLPKAALVAAAAHVLPDAQAVHVERLDAPDAYWYSHHASRPLPALRIAFDDPAASWLMIDMTTGRIVGAQSSGDRAYRWLFNLAHQYDLPWLLERPALRMILIWLLSLLGIAVSLTGGLLAWRVLRFR